MHKIDSVNHIAGGWKPRSIKIHTHAPLHDWQLVMQPGWGDDMKRNLYARALTHLLVVTEFSGLCGRVVPDW